MSDKPVGVISQADEAVLDMVDHGGESAAACTKAHWNCSRTRFRLGTEYVSRTPLRAARYLRHPFRIQINPNTCAYIYTITGP